jgi:cell division protein FtsL
LSHGFSFVALPLPRKTSMLKNMTSLTTFLIIGTLVAAVTIVTIQQARYRRIIKKKNEGIIKQIYEQNQLQKKMEDLEVEKQVMERMLQKKLEN